MMTSTQVVETLVNVTTNSPSDRTTLNQMIILYQLTMQLLVQTIYS